MRRWSMFLPPRSARRRHVRHCSNEGESDCPPNASLHGRPISEATPPQPRRRLALELKRVDRRNAVGIEPERRHTPRMRRATARAVPLFQCPRARATRTADCCFNAAHCKSRRRDPSNGLPPGAIRAMVWKTSSPTCRCWLCTATARTFIAGPLLSSFRSNSFRAARGRRTSERRGITVGAAPDNPPDRATRGRRRIGKFVTTPNGCEHGRAPQKKRAHGGENGPIADFLGTCPRSARHTETKHTLAPQSEGSAEPMKQRRCDRARPVPFATNSAPGRAAKRVVEMHGK